MASHINCDGLRRRDFLKVGAMGCSGLTLSSYLRSLEGAEPERAAGNSAIFIFLPGGPSHLDTFDMKPDAPREYRGEFKPIATNVPGIEFCELMPNLARCADKFTILRGVTHSLGAHPLGRAYINTGTPPLQTLQYPGYGSVVSKEFPPIPGLPPFVAVPTTEQRPGFLGVKYAPLDTGTVPRPGEPYSVRGISLSEGVTVADLEKRHSLLNDLDTAFRGYDSNRELLEGLDEFSRQANSLIMSKRARDAFDISKESPAFAEPFGKTGFGQSCLLATRLIGAGVRFVTLTYGGWDTHSENWEKLKDDLLPPFDEGLAALFSGLESKGLLDTTSVFVTGEFGRSPKSNSRGGRDHHPHAMFMLMAGGKIRGGRVLGASDERGKMPVGDGYSPDDVAATFYANIGIDHTKEYHTNTGRPVMIVRNGKPIRELVG